MITIYAHSEKDGLHKIKPADLKKVANKNNIWVDLTNPTPEELKKIGEVVKLHPITKEDLNEVQGRIKYEEFKHYTFVVFSAIKNTDEDEINTYNINCIIGKNFLITSKTEGSGIIGKLKTNEEKIDSLMAKGPDYVMHSILDLGVDLYFPFAQKITNKIDKIDETLTSELSKDDFDALFENKRLASRLRSVVLQLSDVFAKLARTGDNFISNSVEIYYRDILDHTRRLNTILKDANNDAVSILNEHLAMSSSKMNDIILVLTIFSSIMLPLTFLTGLFGMNVALPFSDSSLSFFVIMGFMIVVSGIMILYFKRRRWF